MLLTDVERQAYHAALDRVLSVAEKPGGEVCTVAMNAQRALIEVTQPGDRCRRYALGDWRASFSIHVTAPNGGGEFQTSTEPAKEAL